MALGLTTSPPSEVMDDLMRKTVLGLRNASQIICLQIHLAGLHSWQIKLQDVESFVLMNTPRTLLSQYWCPCPQ